MTIQQAEKIQTKLIEAWGGDREIAESAWVSTGTDKRTDEDVARVVGMLADLGHGVPFEAVHFRWWVRVPRYVETQLVKHRISSINGASGRYRKVRPGYQDIDVSTYDMMMELGRSTFSRYHTLCQQAYNYYDQDMKRAKDLWGISSPKYKRFKEFYRGVLPQAQMTELHITLNLRSFANFYKQRSAPDAQKEIQQVAEGMFAAIQDVCPLALQALAKNDWRI